MNTDWKIVAGTLGIFVAGLVTGAATFGLARHVHRPPFPMMREFGPRDGGPGWGREHRPEGREDGFHGRPPFLTPAFEKELRDYHEKLKAVLDPYGAKIRAVLTADQQKKLEQVRRPGPGGEGGERGGPEGMEGPEGGMRFVGMVIYRPLLDRMARDLQLDAGQQAQLEALFKARREALLAFLDANPPPTIKMALDARPPAPPPGDAAPAPATPPAPR